MASRPLRSTKDNELAEMRRQIPESRLDSQVFATLFCAVLLLLLILDGCASPVKRAPDRPSSTRDLLVGLPDMPSGWITDGPERGYGDLCVGGRDCSMIAFRSIGESKSAPVIEEIYQYEDSLEAEVVFDNQILPLQVGRTPGDWKYVSRSADESHFACYDYEGRQPGLCKWSARYDEYVVRFTAWLDYMSGSDIERIVKLIDLRMSDAVQKSSSMKPASTSTEDV